MRGFSFVELLIATSLVALSGAGLITLQTHLVHMNEQQTLRTHARFLAQEKLDDLANFQWLTSPTSATDDFRSIASNKGGQMNGGQIVYPVSAVTSVRFQRSWQSTALFFVDTSGDGQPDSWQTRSQLSLTQRSLPLSVQAKHVVVTVSWTNFHGRLNTVTAEGVIAPILAARAGVALNPYVAPIPYVGLSVASN